MNFWKVHSSEFFVCMSIMFGAWVFPYSAAADEGSQVLSVTPPLFQLSILPGDLWNSSVKVVNSNPYELTVYAEVVNFQAQGENGLGRFIPIMEEDKNSTATLAHWIHIGNGPYVIPAEQSLDIPIFVEVPIGASPGGHFAAVLIGTEPPENNSGASALLTSQMVTSLFFARIEGEIDEVGDIREFRTADRLVDVPEATFSLRFENKGNVHLIPRGTIVVTNMWGKERGVIPINHQTQYGNVLPRSIREYQFLWKGERSITEIGQYKAVATLAYGEDGSKTVTATTYFYVLPLKATLTTLAVIIGFFTFLTWAIRLYVRRMLALAGVPVKKQPLDLDDGKTDDSADEEVKVVRKRIDYRSVARPLTEGVIDLRGRVSAAENILDTVKTIGGFVATYKFFFLALVVLVVGFVAGVLYIADASKAEKSFEFSVPRDSIDSILDTN